MSPPDGTLLYEEKQGFGRLLKIVALILAVWILTYAIIIISKHGGRQPDISPSQAFMLAMVPLPMIIFLTTFPFMARHIRIETQVRSGGLYVRLRPFFWRHVPRQDLRIRKVVTFRPIRDFVGYGWHRNWWTKTTYYNASGNRGVRIDLPNGGHLLIGSQTPEQLNEAIAQMVAQ